MNTRLPHSIETEHALLGTLLLRPNTVPVAASLTEPEDCYEKRSEVVLRAIFELYREGVTPDLPSTTERLLTSGTNIQASWMASLVDQVIPLTGKVEDYARTIKKHAESREMIRLLQGGIEQLVTGSPCNQAISDLLPQINKIMASSQGRVAKVSEILPSVLKNIENTAAGKGKPLGINTGFYALDRLTSGLRPSELIIIAARPSMGKTAFALNLITHAALKGHSVLFFSLEMEQAAIMERMISSLVEVDYGRIRQSQLSPEEIDRIRAAKPSLESLPITIDDRSSLNISQIEARVAEVYSSQPIDLIVVDYLQLCRCKAESRYVEVSEVSHFLKSLAKKYEVPVVALSQLSRDIEKRNDPRPKLSDLRESGAIEQDADIILFIGGKKEATARDLIIAKHRNGPLGELALKFVGHWQRFEEISFSDTHTKRPRH